MSRDCAPSLNSYDAFPTSMPGHSRGPVSVVGLAVAAVAVVGWILFDWDFGANDGFPPLVIGVLAAVVGFAVFYRRLVKS